MAPRDTACAQRKSRKSKLSAKKEFVTMLKKISADINKGQSVSRDTYQVLEDMMMHILQLLAREGCRLVSARRKITLTAEDIRAAVVMIMPNDLGRHTVCFADKALCKFLGVNKK